MKLIIVLFALFFVTTLFLQNSFACECSWEDLKMNKEKAKNFYLNSFEGAIFSGKIINIEIEEENGNRDGNQIIIKKITIKIRKNWKG